MAPKKHHDRAKKALRRSFYPAAPFHVIGSDGRLCVSAGLYGPKGEGLRMVVDAAAWGMIVPVYGHRWTIKEAKKGYRYVVAMGSKGGTYLARLVTKASPGEVVVFLNGDALDMSRGNLATLGAGEARKRAFARIGNS